MSRSSVERVKVMYRTNFCSKVAAIKKHDKSSQSFFIWVKHQYRINPIFWEMSKIVYEFTPKDSYISTPYRTCPEIWRSTFDYLLMCLENCWMRRLIWIYPVCTYLSVRILRMMRLAAWLLLAIQGKGKLKMYIIYRGLTCFSYVLPHPRPPRPASVAHLDARPTGDQEVTGSTLAGSATFFRGDRSWNIFYGHSLSSADSRTEVVSFWRKNVHNTV